MKSAEWDEYLPEKKERLERELEHNIKTQKRQIAHSVDQPYIMAVIEAVFFPWSSSSLGTHQSSIPSPYTPPRYLHIEVMNYTFTNRGWSRTRVPLKTLKESIACMLWWVIAFSLLPIGFVLLPISRRRAKVRWGHIMRITAYGLFIPVTIIILAACVYMIGIAYGPTCAAAIQVMYYISLTVMPLVVIWWAVAIKRYLRIPHGWAVALLLGAVATLTPVGFLAILYVNDVI